MAFELGTQSSSLCVVHINVLVITTGQDLIGIELQTGNNMSLPLMSPKRNVPWLYSFLHPALAD
jgi:hypothetical protein